MRPGFEMILAGRDCGTCAMAHIGYKCAGNDERHLPDGEAQIKPLALVWLYFTNRKGRSMADKKLFIATANIESKILLIRGQKAMLDADLAELYGVETRALNQALKRNVERFPEDFAFQLTAEESANLISQNVTSSWGGRRKLPYVFTEHGALMLGNVLKSERAVEVSLMVVRAFIRMRELVEGNKELAQKLNQLERKVGAHDKAIAEIINAIRQLMAPSDPNKKRPIGFAPWKEK
ncbi:ORF6N domain protein [mine drainage metagenome]|uniref:ORF6N domain protein n=1 Tax=mine drainage metagenome TaxID=410659 RepID=A0A1J5S3J0_9ZZZZ